MKGDRGQSEERGIKMSYIPENALIVQSDRRPAEVHPKAEAAREAIAPSPN